MIRGRDDLQMDPVFRDALPPGDPFDAVMQLQGDVVRAVDGRRTFRFQLGDRWYFAKTHSGMPWPRILRKLLQLRLPVLGADREWQAIHRLRELHIPTTPPVAFGCRGSLNPARRQSFVVTEDLGQTVTLEQECLRWPDHPPRNRFRLRLIREVARISRTLHEAGLHHRDFYLCHFRLDLNAGDPRRDDSVPLRLHLMDLHRVQQQTRLSRRARVKDIGGLYFSAMDIGLHERDLFRFMRLYRGTSLRKTLQDDADLWRAVTERARWQYRKEHG